MLLFSSFSFPCKLISNRHFFAIIRPLGKRSRETVDDGEEMAGEGDDIQGLLGIIGQRLHKQYETKKRKLEGFAEKIVASSSGFFHTLPYYSLARTKANLCA